VLPELSACYGDYRMHAGNKDKSILEVGEVQI
jgi:hypothetical protein